MTKMTKWSIDHAHSGIAFTIRHLTISNVKGSFRKFDADIYTNGTDFTTADIRIWIDPSSISTDDMKRDEHLKGVDFFDVATHKEMSFTSNTMGKPDAEGNHELWGELTMKGITRSQKLSVQFGGIINDPQGNEKAGITVTGRIKRKEWGLVWNKSLETGGLMVGEDISILCELELLNESVKGTWTEMVTTLPTII